MADQTGKSPYRLHEAKVGHSVTLNSGSHLMTVNSIFRTHVVEGGQNEPSFLTTMIGCVWFDDNRTLQTADFDIRSLQLKLSSAE